MLSARNQLEQNVVKTEALPPSAGTLNTSICATQRSAKRLEQRCLCAWLSTQRHSSDSALRRPVACSIFNSCLFPKLYIEISFHAFLKMHARFAVKSKPSKKKSNIQTSISKFFAEVNKKPEGDSANKSGINSNTLHLGVGVKVNTNLVINTITTQHSLPDSCFNVFRQQVGSIIVKKLMLKLCNAPSLFQRHITTRDHKVSPSCVFNRKNTVKMEWNPRGSEPNCPMMESLKTWTLMPLSVTVSKVI